MVTYIANTTNVFIARAEDTYIDEVKKVKGKLKFVVLRKRTQETLSDVDPQPLKCSKRLTKLVDVMKGRTILLLCLHLLSVQISIIS